MPGSSGSTTDKVYGGTGKTEPSAIEVTGARQRASSTVADRNTAGRTRRKLPGWGVAAAGVAALAVVLVVSYGLTGGFGEHSAAKSEVLIPKGTFYSIPARQSNAVDFQTSTGGVVKGAIWNTWGINVYLMTPEEDYNLAEKGSVEGYVWSSGRIANLTETNLSIMIEPGAWDVVFFNADDPSMNPIWTNTTVIGFYTAISLMPN